MHERFDMVQGRERVAGFSGLPGWALSDRATRNAAVDHQHLRMFVLSHLCGPFIGLVLSGFLLVLGFPTDARLGGFTALICLFWLYPVALAIGASYKVLSLASLQHLTLVIFWASHGYGGLTSPFLLWLAVVPLLTFLYSAPRLRLWMMLLVILALNSAAFAVIALFIAAPPPVDPEAIRWLAIVSLLAASAYVAMMAVYFGRVLSSRNEMAMEVAHRRATAVSLDRKQTQLRHLRAAKIASLSRLVRQCRTPVDDILDNCGAELDGGAERSASNTSDLNNIFVAAARMRRLLEAADEYCATLRDLPAAASRT